MTFRLTDQIIDPSAQRQELLSRSAGAFCAYEGWVRDHNEGKSVRELHYSSYAQLAPAIAEAILKEATHKFALESAAVVHRTGALTVGDIAVWVGVTAHHRGDTFLACRYIIDNVKHRLPIWKKEHYTDGSEAWIESNHCGCADPASLAHLKADSPSLENLLPKQNDTSTQSG
ncbi:MAG: molybdenum cofactor biosynthesis protein MoaE [Puniceicoccaceae bacterium]|nr:MAG: molybdenum cofactor biosynthesis protein MoaE [Puniceicoccaceae bacterium]